MSWHKLSGVATHLFALGGLGSLRQGLGRSAEQLYVNVKFRRFRRPKFKSVLDFDFDCLNRLTRGADGARLKGRFGKLGVLGSQKASRSTNRFSVTI